MKPLQTIPPSDTKREVNRADRAIVYLAHSTKFIGLIEYIHAGICLLAGGPAATRVSQLVRWVSRYALDKAIMERSMVAPTNKTNSVLTD